nr:StAR-related lipid transfer protein like [Ipomoea batatas]
MKYWGGMWPSESGIGLLVSSPGKFWEERVDGGGGGARGWTLSGCSYACTMGVVLIILTCQLLNRIRSSRLRLSLSSSSSSSFLCKSAGKGDAAPPCSGTNREPAAHISSSLLPQSRISTIISDLDLKDLIENLDEKLHCNEKWEHVIDRRADLFSYTAKCCKPKDGPKYISGTVFENCSIELLRDFYMDYDFRQTWDKTLVGHGQIQVDTGSGTEIGWMTKKFPLMTPREYVIAWKLWEGNDGSIYCFSKECEHPLIPRQKKYVRVALFRSGWRIKKVSGRNACEIKMVYQEDSGMNVEMARLAFAKGIWSYICKMHTAFRKYSTIGHSQLNSGVTAITLIQKVPPELEAISNTTDAIHPGTSTSSAHIHHGLPHEMSARKLLSKPSIKLMKSAFFLIGGAICLSRGHSNLGVKVAMACILGNLTKQNASAFKKQKSKERGGLAGLTSHEDCGTIQ